MKLAVTVLLQVAKELAEKARNSVPHLRDGEKITREWLSGGVYHRETVFNGATSLARYDFRERKVI